MPLHQHLLGQWEPVGSWKLQAHNVFSIQGRDVRLDIRKIFLGHDYWCTKKDLSGVIAGSPLPKGLKRLEEYLSKMTLPKNMLPGAKEMDQGDVSSFSEPIFMLGLSISLPHLWRPVLAPHSYSAFQPGDQGVDFSVLWIWGCTFSTWLSCREKNYQAEQPRVN